MPNAKLFVANPKIPNKKWNWQDDSENVISFEQLTRTTKQLTTYEFRTFKQIKVIKLRDSEEFYGKIPVYHKDKLIINIRRNVCQDQEHTKQHPAKFSPSCDVTQTLAVNISVFAWSSLTLSK